MTDNQLMDLKNDPKGFLMKGRQIHNKIEAKLERINRLRQIAESVTAEIKPGGGFGGGTPSSKTENCIVNIIDLQNEIKDEIYELVSIETAIKQAIDMIPDVNNTRMLLELRHLNYYSWEKVAECMGRSYRWVLALYERSLEFFRQI